MFTGKYIIPEKEKVAPTEIKTKEEKVEYIHGREVLNLWYEKRKQRIENVKKKKIGEIIDSDPQVGEIRKHIEVANEIINKIHTGNSPLMLISPSYQYYLTKESKNEIDRINREVAELLKDLDGNYKEIRAMMILCAGKSEKEAEVLSNYYVTDGVYGRIRGD